MNALKSHRASPYGIRTSLEPFSEFGNFKIIPLYALGSTNTLYN